MYHSEQPSSDDFRILGVKPGASPHTVRSAYKSLVRTWHPDRFPEGSPEKSEAEEKLKRINSAYRRIRSTWKVEAPGNGRNSPDAGREEKEERDTPHAATPEREPFRPPSRPLGLVKEWAQKLKQAGTLLHPYRRWLPTAVPILLALALFLINGLNAPESHRHAQNHPATPLPPIPDTGRGGPPQQTPETASPPANPASIEPPGSGTPATAPPPNRPPAESHSENGEAVFSLGSTQKEVLRVQGPPQKIQGQTWIYGLSSIGFKEGRVHRYSNFDGSLRVRVLPSTKPADGPPPSYFSLHAGKDRVLQVQGTPTRIEGDKWYYGFSEVHFKEGKVVGFNNFFNNLHIRMEPTAPPGPVRDHFTIGSTMDEVLSLQGTPTSIQGNLWSYNLSSILFQDGKVRFASNLSGNLRFVPPKGEN